MNKINTWVIALMRDIYFWSEKLLFFFTTIFYSYYHGIDESPLSIMSILMSAHFFASWFTYTDVLLEYLRPRFSYRYVLIRAVLQRSSEKMFRRICLTIVLLIFNSIFSEYFSPVFIQTQIIILKMSYYCSVLCS